MWKDLTLEQKAEIMKMSVANGVTDINDIRALYDGSVGHRFDDAGRIITLADLPREYVQRYGHINVVTPKGVRMPLSQAYKDYNQTPINVNDVPGLTDYLIKQDQPDISEQAHINKVAADRFVHQLGEERDKALIGLAAAITGGGALASGLALAPVATIGSTIGGIAGEKAFNAGYEKLTGSNWGQDVERWTKGYIPAEYGEYLNPGTLIGGITGDVASKVGRKIFNTASLSRAMNKSIGIIPDNVYINRLNSVPLITKENAKLIPDYMWDDAYFKAINAKDIVEAQRLRDLHFASKANYTPVTIDSQGNPITWYTGSEFGNHSVFDSSKMNATIGGSSIRGEKGNFTTTDLPAAEHYAGINRFSDRNVQEYTTPETIKEKVLDFFGLYKPKFIHPVDRISKEVSPDLKSLYNTGSQSVLDRIQSGQKVDKVVYPLYINGNKLRQVDFEGRPWSRVPDNVEINNRYVVEEYTPNGGYDYSTPNKTREYLNKEDAVRDYDSMTGTHGTMENGIVNKQDPSTLENKNFDWHNGQQVRSVMEFASKPSFNKAILKEIRTPRTTNGLVQDSFRKDYDLVYMKDVIDSNGGINGESYAIDDLVTRYSNQMKLANAITYDDAGNIIPLSKRDNFNIRDIRYGWLLPFGITLGAGAATNSQAYGGPTNTFAGRSNKPNVADTTGGIVADLGVNLMQQQIEENKKALGGHLFDKGGHLYKNAGPLNKKQAPKYRYGLIEQALVEGGAGGKFRVTSGKRKPNEAGNKGNSSAHTYTLANGDPAAIDIVPVGITGQELLDIMASPLMQATLSKYGFDILNESSKEMMAKNAATGQHLHVGKGIKGQQGKGQIFGGSTWGTLGRNTEGAYTSSSNPIYTSIPSSGTQTSEPFGVKAPKDEVNPWVKFLAEMQQSTRPASPAQKEENTPALTAQSNLTDFSSLNTSPRVEEAVQQANSQPALAYMPDITSDPLWNESYDLFEPNTLANVGAIS